ncbi:DUF4942 domain-containing protein [Photobacterium damselae]|uniref:DUF4942 domain-containing protein n=1 Tax=Photobacterium damselae TaxID=38293 RepID=UPI001F2B7739|nr:DUF4942 domain-containing protein [Photobacterium damselae]UKA04978.1 DUF4942 domain-containing protein [Photobacterium damselae subsp. damselae]
MKQTTALTEQKLIEHLVALRNDFITTFTDSVLLHKRTIEIARKINYSIPTVNAGYVDDFNSIFYSISSAFGEFSRNRIRPKESSISSLSDDKIRELITKKVDGNLWDTMFNRLGLYKSMSAKQKSEFKTACNENPMNFTLDAIEDTLISLVSNQEEIMIEGLYDTFSSLDSTYVSNNERKFGKKVIIRNAFHEYGDSFKLTTHQELQSLLEIVWRWILANRWEMTENGVSSNQIWDYLSQQLSQSNQDYDELKSIETFGIEFRFFRNKNVHVLFPESMIALLNTQMSKKSYLPK